MVKKILAALLLSLAFLLWGSYFIPISQMSAKMGEAALAIPLVADIKIQNEIDRDVRTYDYLDSDYQLIMITTSYFYSRISGASVGFNSGFSAVRITGDLAQHISLRCSCLGYTDTNVRIVVVLADRMTLREETLILSHELTHVLQFVKNRVPDTKLMAEYQAEVVSRWSLSILDSSGRIGMLDTKPASDQDLERLKNSAYMEE